MIRVLKRLKEEGREVEVERRKRRMQLRRVEILTLKRAIDREDQPERTNAKFVAIIERAEDLTTKAI